MQTSIPRLFLATLALSPAVTADVVADWDFSSLVTPPAGTPPAVPLLDATMAGTAPGVLASGLTAERAQPGYTGLLWSDANAADGELNLRYFDGDPSDPGTSNDGVSDNYLAFTLYPMGGALDVDRLSVSVWRNGTGAPALYRMEVVVDGGSPQPFGLSVVDGSSGDFGYDWFEFDGSVSADTSLEVRFRPVATPGGQGTGNLHINGLRVESGTGGGPPSGGPNVLFLIADDLTATALGCYGHPTVQTPNIDALAARGMVFDRAYCQYPVCSWSRSSLMTGMYPARIAALGGTDTNFDGAIGSHVTLAELFRTSGYTTARASKLYHMRVPGDMLCGAAGPDHADSWDLTYNVQSPEWMTPGAAGNYTTDALNFDPTLCYDAGFGAAFYVVNASTSGIEQADVITAMQGRSYLDSLQSGPFFLGLGFVRPHVPLVAPSSYFDLYDHTLLPLAQSVPNDLDDIPAQGVFWDEPVRGPLIDDHRRRVLQAYYASVTFMDEQVGAVLDHLRNLGLEEETYVVFTSDHGYHLGEHTMWQKLSLHEESARVPLIIAGPGIESGRRDALVELIDLYPTLADYAGLPIPTACQGRSLRTVIDDPTAVAHSTALSSVSNGHLLRTTDWAYMRYSAGGEELYDMRAGGDPLQFTNLEGDPAHAGTLAELRGLLDERLLAAAHEYGNAYCFGDGTGAACPCAGWGGAGQGCANSSGAGATLTSAGSSSVMSDDLTFTCAGLLPGQPALLFAGLHAVQGGAGTAFGDGLRCVGGGVVRLGIRVPDAGGGASWGPGLGATGGWSAGDTSYFQAWYRDPAGGPCGSGFNLTHGVELTFVD